MESLFAINACHYSLIPSKSHKVLLVVVTPLAAITKDQVSDFGCKQISAVEVTSSMDEVVESEILDG